MLFAPDKDRGGVVKVAAMRAQGEESSHRLL